METKGNLKLGGMIWWQALVCIVLCAIPMYMGTQSSSMTGTLCSIFALAVVFNEIGKKLPIWNKYIGGGLLMSFFGVQIMNRSTGKGYHHEKI